MNNGFDTTYINLDDHNYWRAMDFTTVSYKVNINVKIEAIGGRVEDFAIEPNEKLTLEAGDGALFLVSKEKRIPIAPLNDMTGDYGRYFMQKDKIDEMMHKANELKSSSDPMQRAIGQELVKILKDYGLVDTE